MSSIPTYVAASSIAGFGVFTPERLPAGTKIWNFSDGVDWRIGAEDFERLPEPCRERLRHFLYEEGDGALVLCGDNAKFMNHSTDPNCSDADPVHTVTRRVVEAGEELTCDYREVDLGSRVDGLDFETSLR